MTLIYGQKKKKGPGIITRCIRFVKWISNPKICFIPMLLLLSVIIFICLLGYTFSTLEPIAIKEKLVSGNFSGVLEKNNDLASVLRKKTGQIWAPNSVLFHAMSMKLYIGQLNGNILTINVNEMQKTLSQFYYKFGRIVGLRARKEYIYVGDSVTGVYRIDTDSKKTKDIMPLDVVDPPIRSLMDFALGGNGHIYAIDSNLKYSSEYYMHQLLEGECTGRLIHYSPVINVSKVVKSNLCMPTGVELTFNEDCLMVSEAARGRVVVVKLNDTNVASTQILPGLPGRIRFNTRGSSWLTVQILNDWFFDFVLPKFYLRKILTAVFPESYLKSWAFSPHTMIVELHEGNATDSLHDLKGKFNDRITDVTEVGSLLYLGNDNAGFIGKLGEKDIKAEMDDIPKPELDEISKQFL